MWKWFAAAILCLGSDQLLAKSHTIQLMLTVPRTVSTAFERSIMARGDHKVFHEPWNMEYIYRLGKLHQAIPSEIAEACGYAGIKRLLYRYAEHSPVYVKDMIWAIKDELLSDSDFLSDPQVILTLLIRDPTLSIESFFLKISEKASLEVALELTRDVFRYDSLVLLAEKYHAVSGKWPVILEAEELCARPVKVMQFFCQEAGISYLPEALAWPKGMPVEWEPLARWHEDAAESETFFLPQREAKRRFSAIPEAYIPVVEAIYQEQKPHYDKLRTFIICREKL